MTTTVIYTLAGIMGLAATILAYIFIVNKKNIKNKFFKFLHDLFNFKDLWLEKVMKFLYVLSTLTGILYGFFTLFQVEKIYVYDGYNYHTYTSMYHYEYEWVGYWGFVIMIAAPIVIRLMYEAIMMFILLVKNTIEINNKLEGKAVEAPKAPVAPKAPAAPAAPAVNKPRFCKACGAQVDPNGKCTGCGMQN